MHAVFTKTKMNKEWNIDLLLNYPLDIQHTYSIYCIFTVYQKKSFSMYLPNPSTMGRMWHKANF